LKQPRNKVLLPLKLTPQAIKFGVPQSAPSTLHLIQSKELGLQQIPLKMGGLWGLIDVEITFKNNIINLLGLSIKEMLVEIKLKATS
jgi:hypothetical protein